MNDIPLGPRRIEQRPPPGGPADDEAIRRLLHAVGPRPAVPEDAVGEAREAARTEWRRKVMWHARRRRRRQAGWLAAAATALLAVGLTFWMRTGAPWTSADVQVAVLETVTGPVTVRTADAAPPLPAVHSGDPIAAGAVLETGTSSAVERTVLRLGDGASVRLYADTRLRVVSSSAVELERGAVYVDSATADPSVEVLTALGTARDVGTVFDVRLLGEGATGQEALRLRVYDGLVLLSQEGAEPHEAQAGTELTLRRDGTLTRGTVPPPFDADGQTLAALLEWVCREGGWALDDEDVAELAPTVILTGDAEGMTPYEAAYWFLRSSGLEGHLKDGVFEVKAPGP